MSKHFDFRDRVRLQTTLENFPRCSAQSCAKQLGKSRSAIYCELNHFTRHFPSRSQKFNDGLGNYPCPHLQKFPFCCTGCSRTSCVHRCREYEAYFAQHQAERLLHNSRSDTARVRQRTAILNRTVSPLILQGLSIAVALNVSRDCDLSQSTIRRYVNRGLLDAKRCDLPSSVRFKVKKQYD